MFGMIEEESCRFENAANIDQDAKRVCYVIPAKQTSFV